MRLWKILLHSGLLFYFFPLAAQHLQVISTYQSFGRQIDNVLFAPDSVTLLASDSEGYLFFWDASGNLSKIIRPHLGSLTGIAVSPDMKYFATASSENLVYIWDFINGNKVNTLTLDARCIAFTFNNQGNILFVATNKAIYRVSANSAQMVKVYESPSHIVSARKSEDGKYFVAGELNAITFLDMESGKLISEVISCEGMMNMAAGKNLVAGLCRNGSLQLFEVSKKGSINLKRSVSISVTVSIGFLILEAENILHCNTAGELTILKTASGKFYEASGVPSPATALGSGIEAGHVLIGSSDGSVYLCSITTKPEEIISESKTTLKTVDDSNAKNPEERPVQVRQKVEVHSAQLDIYVWDDEHVDGDTISLSLNGEWILQHYMVTAEKKKISVTLAPGKESVIALYAHNLGTKPPNTAAISFNDGTKEQVLTLKSDLNRSDAVSLILKR